MNQMSKQEMEARVLNAKNKLVEDRYTNVLKWKKEVEQLEVQFKTETIKYKKDITKNKIYNLKIKIKINEIMIGLTKPQKSETKRSTKTHAVGVPVNRSR